MSEFLSVTEYNEKIKQIPTELRKLVTGMEKRGKIVIKCEPDSCVEAWNFYRKMYKNRFDFTDSVLILSNGRYISDVKLDGKQIRLGGDCDFNFSSKKIKKSTSNYTSFSELIDISQATEEQKKRVEKKLDICGGLHHSLINFSLMPTVGGLNNTKGANMYDDLLFFLNKISKWYLKKGNLLKRKNYEILKSHLHKIETFEEYLKLYYFEEVMIDFPKLQSGEYSLPFSKNFVQKNLNNLEKYLDAAALYWISKANFYNEIINEEERKS